MGEGGWLDLRYSKPVLEASKGRVAVRVSREGAAYVVGKNFCGGRKYAYTDAAAKRNLAMHGFYNKKANYI